MSSSQRPLPDKTQHSQQINIHALPVGFEPTISAGERLQTYVQKGNNLSTYEYSFKEVKCSKIYIFYCSIIKASEPQYSAGK
jgi:hypothetical protein